MDSSGISRYLAFILVLQMPIFLISGTLELHAAPPVSRSSAAFTPSGVSPSEQRNIDSLSSDLKKLSQKRAKLIEELRKVTKSPANATPDDVLSYPGGMITSNTNFFAEERYLAQDLIDHIRKLDARMKEKQFQLEVNQNGHAATPRAHQLASHFEVRIQAIRAELIRLKALQKAPRTPQNEAEKEGIGREIRETRHEIREIEYEREKALAGKYSEDELRMELMFNHVHEMTKMNGPARPTTDSTGVTGNRAKQLPETPADTTSGSRTPASSARGLR
ncbi:MAG: hypothetical protein H7222_12930 [Methylotenera sp.]|nr:hypothetical protein [Oligoflexia bacterium]